MWKDGLPMVTLQAMDRLYNQTLLQDGSVWWEQTWKKDDPPRLDATLMYCLGGWQHGRTLPTSRLPLFYVVTPWLKHEAGTFVLLAIAEELYPVFHILGKVTSWHGLLRVKMDGGEDSDILDVGVELPPPPPVEAPWIDRQYAARVLKSRKWR